MKIKSNLINRIILIASLLVLLPMVSATIAQGQPPTGSNQSANFMTNWTFVNVTDGITNVNSANSTFYWNGTGSWVAVTKTNFACTAAMCNATLDISTMGEGMGVLNFTAGNTTLRLGGTLGGAFRVDKTAPTATISTDVSRQERSKDVILTWSGTDSGSGVQTTSVTLTGGTDAGCAISGTTSFSTATGTQTLTGTQTQCAGTYTATIVSTDYSGLQSTTSTTFDIYHPSGGSVTIPQTVVDNGQLGGTNKNKLMLIIGISAATLAVLGLGSLALYLSLRKKRR